MRLSIPSPCTQKWASFKPTKAGGYCNGCQKEVIDFTSFSDQQLIEWFSKSTTACGRFRPEQLKQLGTENKRTWWLGTIVVFIALMFSKPATAQTAKSIAVSEQIISDSTTSKLEDLKKFTSKRADVVIHPAPPGGIGEFRSSRMGGVIATGGSIHTIILERLKSCVTKIEDLLYLY